MSQKKENFKLKLEKLWSRGFMDDREFYEWLDFYSYPLEKTNFFMRRQLYPTFGSNVIFLGKIELIACLDHQKKGFERTIQSYRASLNERLRKERFFKRWGRKLK